MEMAIDHRRWREAKRRANSDGDLGRTAEQENSYGEVSEENVPRPVWAWILEQTLK